MLRKNLLLQLSLAALALMPQAMKAQFNWPYKNAIGPQPRYAQNKGRTRGLRWSWHAWPRCC